MANGVVNRNDRKEGKEIEFESKIGISMERGREGERERERSVSRSDALVSSRNGARRRLITLKFKHSRACTARDNRGLVRVTLHN